VRFVQSLLCDDWSLNSDCRRGRVYQWLSITSITALPFASMAVEILAEHFLSLAIIHESDNAHHKNVTFRCKAPSIQYDISLKSAVEAHNYYAINAVVLRLGQPD